MASSLYEMVYIIDSTLPEAELKQLESDVKSTIQSRGGEIKKESQWGERRMAYEIRKKTHGQYFNYEFTAEDTVPREVTDFVQTKSSILRHLIIKVPKAKLLQEKQEEEKKRKELEAAQKEREKALAAQKAQEEREAREAEEAAKETEEIPAQEVSVESSEEESSTLEEPKEESASASESEETEEPRNE